MSSLALFTAAGAVLYILGFHAVMARAHLVWKVLGFNVMGGGVFLVLLSAAPRLTPEAADPVPQAMVLTGIVVAVGATALALGLALRVAARTGELYLTEDLPRADDAASERS